nr:unnamed protein product [Digitaria exilis]
MRIRSLLVFLVTAVLLSLLTATAENDAKGLTVKKELFFYKENNDGLIQIDRPEGSKNAFHHALQPLLLVILTAMLFFSTAGAIGCYNHENMTTRVKPLYYDCGCLNAANDSNYGNRMGLASKLMENISASQDNFFASYTVGSVFGFVLCRGDYNGSNCADRLNQTIKDYISVTDTNQMICPSSMDVTIYYDQHMVSFFSGGGDGEEYKGLGSNMPAWVASNMNYVMNSTGAAGFYGERVPEKFTTPAGDHCVGGRILGVWCNLRFETELFFEVTQETRKLHKPKNRKLQRELGEWHNEVMREIDSRFSLYHFTMIRDATRNFSEENELGLGSFSFVHRILQAEAH